MILGYLSRPTLFRTTYNDVYDGFGSSRQAIRNYPVLSVASVAVNNTAIPAGTNPAEIDPQEISVTSGGYFLTPWNGQPPGGLQSISTSGWVFYRGLSNVAITYDAGYAIEDEANTIPAAAPYTITVAAPYGSWGQDDGVSFTVTGTALVRVGNSITPTTGQYSVNDGTYTFAAADTGLAVLISYSFIPADIENACIELVSERFRYRSRIGKLSESVGGQETVSYSLKDMPDYVKLSLNPYKSVCLV